MRTLALFGGIGLLIAGYESIGTVKAPPARSSPDRPSVAAAPASTNGFPVAGMYDIVRDGVGGRENSAMWVDVSNRRAFEEFVARDDGSNCRDRAVSIGGGSFSVRMTCDAPDGDIRNIGSERRGSYSERSFEIATETRLWGRPIRETTVYRLRSG